MARQVSAIHLMHGTEWDRMGPNGTEWDRMGPNGTEWMFRLLSSGLCAFCGLGNACCRQWEPEPVLGVCASPAQ